MLLTVSETERKADRKGRHNTRPLRAGVGLSGHGSASGGNRRYFAAGEATATVRNPRESRRCIFQEFCGGRKPLISVRFSAPKIRCRLAQSNV
jgi:hypothetical protein